MELNCLCIRREKTPELKSGVKNMHAAVVVVWR